MTTLRVATINVHSFRQPRSLSGNVVELTKILAPLNLDLIAVQEMRDNEQWKDFAERLSLPFSVCGPPNGTFCNGILSRHRIRSHSFQRTSFVCEGGARSIIQCRLDGVEDLVFAATHLDYRNEDDRLRQLNEFKPHKQNVDIILGDMNALTREDYSDGYYRDIVVGKREKSNWEKTRFDITHLITHQWDYQDALRKVNPKLKDEQIATCPYGTRIDYIYIHPRVDEHWELTQCSIVDTEGATDHNAVFAELKRK